MGPEVTVRLDDGDQVVRLTLRHALRIEEILRQHATVDQLDAQSLARAMQWRMASLAVDLAAALLGRPREWVAQHLLPGSVVELVQAVFSGLARVYGTDVEQQSPLASSETLSDDVASGSGGSHGASPPEVVGLPKNSGI